MHQKDLRIDIGDEKHTEPHRGKVISKFRVSRNGTYAVTYSEDDESVVGWNVKDEIKQDGSLDKIKSIYVMGISDNGILIIDYDDTDRQLLEIYQMGASPTKVESNYSVEDFPREARE